MRIASLVGRACLRKIVHFASHATIGAEMKLLFANDRTNNAAAKIGFFTMLLASTFPGVALSDEPYSAPEANSAPPSGLHPYGIIDGGVRHIDLVSPLGATTQFASGLNTSRFGVLGSEIVSSDLQATLRLESGFNSGTGASANSTSLFDRTADVGLRWRWLDVKAGRMEGFGYELAGSGVTDPLAMALNLPNYSSPAAAGSKAPVLGANPLQAVYSYTYGQLRFNNAVRLSTETGNWSAGVIYSFGGVAGDFSDDSVRAGHLGWHLGQTGGLDAIVQQSLDLSGNRSTLYVLAGSWNVSAFRLQAGFHQIRIDAGFDSAGLGNGASASGILGNSTTVSTVLATAKENFRFQVADLGATWTVAPGRLLTLAAYKSETQGAGQGDSLALVALGKWFLSPRVALYLEADHDNSSGRLAIKPVSGASIATAYMTGINLHF